jgi:hypothetical protein
VVSLAFVPRSSATFAVWSSAWLAGSAAPDDVLDALTPWAEAHDVVAADEATAAATDGTLVHGTELFAGVNVLEGDCVVGGTLTLG